MKKFIKATLLAMLIIGQSPIQAFNAVSIKDNVNSELTQGVDDEQILEVVATPEDLEKELESDSDAPIFFEGDKDDLFLMSLKDPELFKVDIYPGIDTYRNDAKVFIVNTSKATPEQLEFYNNNLDLMENYHITDEEWKVMLDNNTKEIAQPRIFSTNKSFSKSAIITHYTKTGTTYYARWNNGVGMNGAVHIGQLNGRWIFCLEAPQSVSGGSVSPNPSGNVFERFDGKTRRNIGKIIGYAERLYSESGNVEYLIAAQVKLWDALQGVLGYQITYSNKGGIQPYIDTVNQRLGTHNIVPSFAAVSDEIYTAPEINLYWDGYSYVGRVYDSNNVLTSKYPGLCGTSTNNGFQIRCYTANGNTNHLEIRTDWGNLDGQVIDILPGNIPTGALTFDPNPNGSIPEFMNGNQDTVSGISDPISIKLRINVVSAGGDLVVYKDDQYNRPIPGVTFGLFSQPIDEDKYFISSGTTDIYGNILFSKIKGGTYWIKEHSTNNPNVHINNTEFIPVEIRNNERLISYVENPINGGTIEVIKENQNGDRLAGVTFGLFDGHHNELSRVTTDSNGYGKFIGNSFAAMHNNGINGIWNAPRYYVLELDSEDADVIVPENDFLYVDITGPNDNKLVKNGKVVNEQFGTVRVEQIFSRMSRENVDISFASIGYIDPNKPNIGVKIKNNNKVIDEFILNLNKYKNNDIITKQIPIIPGVDNEIKVELFNLEGAKYKFKNLSNIRYLENKEKIDIDKENEEFKISTPIGQLTKQNNFKHDYFEYLSFNDIKIDYSVEDGTIPLTEKIVYRNDFNENINFNESIIEMYQPLDDITYQFEKENNNMYKIDMKVNENNELRIKDLYIEAKNGRVYKAHTELIDNPTTEQDKLNEGYVDKNDVLVAIKDKYLLPSIGYNTLEMQKKNYDYYIQGNNIGLNKVEFKTKQKFYFNKKKTSLKKDYGKEYPRVVSIKPEPIENPDSYWRTNSKKETNDIRKTLVETGKKYSTIYVSTNLKEIGLYDFRFHLPSLEGESDDYYLDHGDYGGNGIYENNYIAKNEIYQLPGDFE